VICATRVRFWKANRPVANDDSKICSCTGAAAWDECGS
jgi:hypothetical protein